MATEVILPRVDMDMTTASISRWFAEDGATVEKGAVLFEIETDKAAMEIDAPATGRLHRLAKDDGAQVPVGSTVAWILAEGEEAPAKVDVDGTTESAAEATGSPNDSTNGSAAAVVPDAIASAAELADAVAPPAAIANGRSAEGPRATPLARRLARERGLDLAAIPGSGPHGRIQASDVSAGAAGAVPPSVLPDISPPRGEIGHSPAPLIEPSSSASSSDAANTRRISPLGGEMPSRSEGGTSSEHALSAETRPLPTPQTTTRQKTLHRTWLRQGEGTPLVLVHGFGSELDGWRPLVSTARLDRPVLALDLPGHGRSQAGPTAFADIVALVAETLHEEGVAEAHLVGHSLGAAIASALADGMVSTRSLFLLSPGGLGPEIDGGFLAGFTRASSEASLAPWMRMLVADPAGLAPGLVAATARRRAEPGIREAQDALARSLFPDATQVFSTRESLARIAAPVRIVFGLSDRIIPARHATGLPGMVAVHLFPGIGHMPHVEARDDVAKLLAMHNG